MPPTVRNGGSAGAGGGRVAVYASDFGSFDLEQGDRLGRYSSGGRRWCGYGLHQRHDEPHGTLIIDAGEGGTGVTPLGLPGEASATFTDAVIIRGPNTGSEANTTGQILQYSEYFDRAGRRTACSDGDIDVSGYGDGDRHGRSRSTRHVFCQNCPS